MIIGAIRYDDLYDQRSLTIRIYVAYFFYKSWKKDFEKLTTIWCRHDCSIGIQVNHCLTLDIPFVIKYHILKQCLT